MFLNYIDMCMVSVAIDLNLIEQKSSFSNVRLLHIYSEFFFVLVNLGIERGIAEDISVSM